MDVGDLARRWAAVWERAWAAKDIEAIAALYAGDAFYRALVFREPERGVDGVRDYLRRNFDVEDEIECRFGEPVAAGDRAAVEWWASWVEEGEELTLAGATVLRFDGAGLVVDHRDYWNQVERREPPFSGW
jgi:nuclear transport factor 2 (NTF2) superfamily protein